MFPEVRKFIFTVALISMSIVSFSVVAAGDPAVGKTKAALCAGCHGSDGISISPDIPNLAGQKQAYLAASMRAYKSGARKNPLMASIMPMISDSDIDNLAAYYSSLK